MLSTNTNFSLRDWFGLVAGISWGLVLSRFFASDNMTGPWLVIFLGPPLVLLIAPERPILAWQLPIVTAALSGASLIRSPEDTAGMVLLDAALLWTVCSFFSSPWALIFYYRKQRSTGSPAVKGPLAAYAGAVLLVFLACGLLVTGFAFTLYPADFADPRERATPFYGLFMVTVGIALTVVIDWAARELRIHKPVRAIFELLLLLGAIVGITALGMAFVDWNSQNASSAASTDGGLCSIVAGLEALAALVWQIRVERGERKAAASLRP